MNNHKIYLKRTIELAEENIKNAKGGPFAAILVKNNKIEFESTNSVTTDFDPSAHAEVQVIRKATKTLKNIDLSEYTIYSSCRPCPMCMGAIYWANLKSVYYAADSKDAELANFSDKFIYDELLKEEKNRTILIEQIAIKEKNLPFKLWLKTEGKIEY